MGEMKRWGKVYEKLRISQAPLKYNFPSTLMVVILIFPNIKHICISKYKNVLYIYIYIHLPAFHLSNLSHPLLHQGTKTLVPLEPNVLFADLKDSLRPAIAIPGLLI